MIKGLHVDNIPVVIKHAPQKVDNSRLLDKMLDNAGLPTARQSWAEVDDLYETLAEAVMSITTSMADNVAVINAYSKNIEPELHVVINAFNSDIIQFAKELNAIHDSHKERTGIIDNADDLALASNIFNEYVRFNDRFKSIVMQPCITISEKVSIVISELQKKAKEENVNEQ